MKKNLNENISRLKSLMNLLTEGSTNPKDWKVGEYYIQTRKGSNERDIIKITYKDETYISFDYVSYNETTKEKTETGTHDKILVSQVPTQVDGAIWEESNETVWNEITKSTTTQPTNTSDGQIPKLQPDQLSENYPYFVKDESLNILYDNKYYINNSGKDKLDEKGNFKDGVIQIWYQSKDKLSVTIDVDLKNNFPTNTSWSNVFNILNTTTLDSNNILTDDAKLYYDIFIKNYVNLIVDTIIQLDSNLDIFSVIIYTKLNDDKLFWSFNKSGHFWVSLNHGEEYNNKIENGKIILTSKDGTVIPFDSNETKPTEEPKPTVEETKYPTINNFSAIADDIYQDLITNKIQGVKIKSSNNQSLSSDNKTIESINFILDINGVEFLATFSENGLSLFDNNSKKQVKPIWTDKILKYRPLNATEKKSGNEWTKTQVELSLDEQLKLLKKQFQELYLL